MFLVMEDWKNDWGGCGNTYKLFKNYKKAKKFFEERKKEIKGHELKYDTIDEEEDFYCESLNGYYDYNHDLVQIIKLEVN